MMAPSPCLMPAHPPQRRRLSPSPSVSLDAWHGMAWLDVRRILATRWPRPPRGRSTPHQQGGTHGAQAATQWAAVRWPASRRHHQHMPRTQQCLFPASRGRQRLGRGSQTSRGAHVPRNPMAGVRRPELPTPVPFPASVEEAWCHQPSPTGISFLIDMGFLISNGGGHGSRLRHGSKTRA